MKKIIQIPVLLTLLLILSACERGELTVKDAWARPTLAGNNSAVYFVIDNPTGENDTLLNVTTNAAGVAEMHMTMAVEGEHDMEGMPQGEVMTMVKQENVPIPSRGEVAFAPGGLHVMLVGVNSDLAVGDTIELTLTLEKAGTMTLQVPVEER
ncbi:MAG TPA: copper chaperone PCu(A)C [Anaerolineales bacterium]|nr:copper chaperone PCu(A)C [Anaerolineales bacterium]